MNLTLWRVVPSEKGWDAYFENSHVWEGFPTEEVAWEYIRDFEDSML